VRGHVDPGKLALSQANNDQNVQQVKADGRDDEQVHGCNLRQMVAQEGARALTRGAAVRAGHADQADEVSAHTEDNTSLMFTPPMFVPTSPNADRLRPI